MDISTPHHRVHFLAFVNELSVIIRVRWFFLLKYHKIFCVHVLFMYNSVPPSPLEDLVISAVTTTSVSLAWVFGSNGNAEITDVIILYVTEANFQTKVSKSNTISNGGMGLPPNKGQVTGLEAYTQYSFSVSVINEAGSSPSVTIQEWTLPFSE